MKIQYLSDIHEEFQHHFVVPKTDADVLVLAGDIDAAGQNTIGFADECAKRLEIPVVVVAGNHEFYNNDPKMYDDFPKRAMAVQQVYESLKFQAQQTDGRVHFLQNDSIMIGDVLFFGATLWTNFDLFQKDDSYARNRVYHSLNDYRRCFYKEADGQIHSLSIPFVESEHKKTYNYIKSILDNTTDTKLCLVTHHGITSNSCDPRYATEITTAAYTSNYDNEFFNNSMLKAAISGHTHCSLKFQVGETWVLKSPAGYPVYGGRENKNFNPKEVIEI